MICKIIWNVASVDSKLQNTLSSFKRGLPYLRSSTYQLYYIAYIICKFIILKIFLLSFKAIIYWWIPNSCKSLSLHSPFLPPSLSLSLPPFSLPLSLSLALSLSLFLSLQLSLSLSLYIYICAWNSEKYQPYFKFYLSTSYSIEHSWINFQAPITCMSLVFI